jgi:hypothetical protein
MGEKTGNIVEGKRGKWRRKTERKMRRFGEEFWRKISSNFKTFWGKTISLNDSSEKIWTKSG